jgi:hypothetical protein
MNYAQDHGIGAEPEQSRQGENFEVRHPSRKSLSARDFTTARGRRIIQE